MPRPKKCRFVGIEPDVKIYKPAGIPMNDLDIIRLSMDELESIRLADFDAKTHEQAAEQMRVSRATFGRILEKGRMKIADALINGKVIIIEGGDFCNPGNWKNKSECGFCKRKDFGKYE